MWSLLSSLLLVWTNCWTERQDTGDLSEKQWRPCYANVMKYWKKSSENDDDDVIKWKHFHVTGPLWDGESTGHWWIPFTKASDVGLWCSLWWTNGWANNRDAGDLRRHRTHYVVTVMICWFQRHSPIEAMKPLMPKWNDSHFAGAKYQNWSFPRITIDSKSALIQEIVWHIKAAIHYLNHWQLNQWWSSSKALISSLGHNAITHFAMTNVLAIDKLRIRKWWRHQMETFSAFLALCEGNPPVTAGFLSQRRVTRSLDVLFDLRLDKRLRKQSRRRWFETPARSLWLHCNEIEKSFSSYLLSDFAIPSIWNGQTDSMINS